MARKTQTELLSDLASKFADNTNGNITPAIYRTFMQDMITASSPGLVAITGSTPVTIVLNRAHSKLSIFNTDAGEVGNVGVPNVVEHVIEMTEPGLYRVGARVSVKFAKGKDLHLQVNTNGVASGFTASTAGQGANKATSISLAGGLVQLNAGDIVSLEGSTDTDGTSVEFLNSFLVVERVALS